MKSEGKMEQLKNPEAQTMDMARQTLSRIKEMDLTPEQHEKVMTLIDNARSEEKAGNLAKALRVYYELKKYLENIKLPENIKKQKQIEKIKLTIKKTTEDHSINPQRKKALISALKSQIKIINKPEDKKLTLYKGGYFKENVTHFDMEEIMSVIMTLENISRDALILYKIEKSQKDFIVEMEFGLVGNPEIRYDFRSAGQDSTTGVGKKFEDILYGRGIIGARQSNESLGYWEEKEKTWKDKEWRPIEIE